ncbi:hypothetical protein EDD22DRAFT_847487 [Suillus occidentalis]|nr:hypothetical protein EDD22DRAFT_847487 [Suillus occidentalis]
MSAPSRKTRICGCLSPHLLRVEVHQCLQQHADRRCTNPKSLEQDQRSILRALWVQMEYRPAEIFVVGALVPTITIEDAGEATYEEQEISGSVTLQLVMLHPAAAACCGVASESNE